MTLTRTTRLLQEAIEDARRAAWGPLPVLERVNMPAEVNLPPLSPVLQQRADAEWKELS